MKFRTELHIDNHKDLIEPGTKIAAVGSCFAENITQSLVKLMFNASSNPFGVLYNPISINKFLSIVKQNRVFRKEDLVFHNNEWHSFYHNSNFSHDDSETAISRINSSVKVSRQILSDSDLLIITYGTSYIYEYSRTSQIVSNCHRIPGSEFNRRILSPDEIKTSINSSIELAKSFNPDIKIIFSVSPVRHIKDGLHNNQLSKSLLHLGIENFVDDETVFYFPAYEILIDDLRDYRYYKEDLVHPNNMAITYIFQKFIESYFSDLAIEYLQKVQPVVNSVNHNPINPESINNIKFLKGTLEKIEILKNEFPENNFENLESRIKKKLNLT